MHAIVSILLFVLLFGVALRIPQALARRATCSVVRAFRQHNAVYPEGARSAQELGLVRPLFSFFRDYRFPAFQVLAQAGIIQTTVDGKFYLAEDNLALARGIRCPVL